ncbi:hypothetical protein X975_20053, partial [Stegodyphus mimosarum]
MAAVAANSELCLTDRLTELRQGLSTAVANPQQPSTTVALLSSSTGSPPYLSVSHPGYGLLSSHPYYNGNGCSGPGAPSMYLNPPVVPPSLLYPQLYSSVAHNQLHPSIHILGSNVANNSDILRSPEPQRSEDEALQTGSNPGSRGSSTGSATSSNGGSTSSIVNLMSQVETSRPTSPRHQIQTSCTTTSNGTTLYGNTSNGHGQTDSSLWRPY